MVYYKCPVHRYDNSEETSLRDARNETAEVMAVLEKKIDTLAADDSSTSR